MRELIFETGEIRRWAQFSGDQNPIHFDPEEARRLGAPGVVVHGMLVLLDVKDHLGSADAVSADSGDGWRLFRSRLRQPVIAGESVRLETRPQGEGLAFSVTSASPERKLITGALVPHEAPGQDNPAWLRLDLPAADIAVRAARLGAAFPRITQPWVIMDALLFSEFLRTGMRAVLADHGIDLVSGTSAGGEFVVQTSHEVAFDRGVLGRPRPLDFGLAIEAPEPEIETFDSGVYVTNSLTARIKGQAVLRMNLSIAVMQDKHAYQSV